MTVQRQDSYVERTADGVQTLFSFDFQYIEDDDIKVYINNILEPETNYQLSGDPNVGGYVNFFTAPVSGSLVLVRRETPQTQETDYPTYGPFPAEAHETALDKLTMLVQEAGSEADILIKVGFRYIGDWQANFYYESMNLVSYPGDNQSYYLCNESHISGTSFDATLWSVILDLDDFWAAHQEALDAAEAADASADAAASSATKAQGHAEEAALSENEAANHEANAGTSAQNASNCSAASGEFATEAELEAWEAEARQMTADSYATQPEDDPVVIYTSNGDGTFTGTPTDPAEYSALHWAAKASAGVAGVTTITWNAPLQNIGTAADQVGQIDPAKVTEWDGNGVVDSVQGTTDQIDVDATDPANPIISISPNFAGGGGGGGLEWQTEVGIDFAAESGKGYPMYAGCTMTLPAVPTDNMQIGWKDWSNDFDQFPCFIDPNGNDIEQLGPDVMTLDTMGQGGTLVWVTDRWLITDVTEISKEAVAPTGLKSVQHFTGVGTTGITDIPINTVDLNKAYINMAFQMRQATGNKSVTFAFLDASTVRINQTSADTGWNYAFDVIEFY